MDSSLLYTQPFHLIAPSLLRGRANHPTPITTRPPLLGFFNKNPFAVLRRSSFAARSSPVSQLPDLEKVEGLAWEFFSRAEGFIYTVADAAANSSDAAAQGSKKTEDWLSGITNTMETVLKVLKDGLSALHVPYSYGFAIILLTVFVKAATFPLTKKQVESALAMRSLQPQVKAIQQRYAGDQERIQLETARLYKLAGVNPLAGCLPTLVTIPVWIGLYRALSNVADEGLLTEGFFWIPSLAGPTTIAARQSGSGTSWLFPFIDGHPPLGWSDTLAYLVLPVLLVASQYISAQIMQPVQGTDPSQKSSQAVTKLLPLMIGYFALSVPSGLSLYWFTNNILSTAQQIWLQKLGGAKNPLKQYNDRTIEDEPAKIQKPDLDFETDKAGFSQEENAASSGLRPGERFKLLKEQEARKRKEREEERKRAEEAAEGSLLDNDQHNPDVYSIGDKDKQIMEENPAENLFPGMNNGGFMHNEKEASAVNLKSSNEDREKEEEPGMDHSSGNQNFSEKTFDTTLQKKKIDDA